MGSRTEMKTGPPPARLRGESGAKCIWQIRCARQAGLVFQMDVNPAGASRAGEVGTSRTPGTHMLAVTAALERLRDGGAAGFADVDEKDGPGARQRAVLRHV